MSFVVDASVTACWAFDDEDHLSAAAALGLMSEDEAFAPTLWWFEVRNTLIRGERRGRITEAGANQFLRDLGAMPIAIDRDPVGADLMNIARRLRLTAYDAAYLELAVRLGATLATLDGHLAGAAKAMGVGLI
jgi:predicted nucleic acid-binding protein